MVVGAGLAGSATAWHLARHGHDVTVLERAEPANPQGSSHGSARIFRYAYPDAFWTDLVVRARRGWTELEALAGEQLITPTGSLDHGRLRDPSGLAGVLKACGVEHELLTAGEAGERWAGMDFRTDVLWHPGAGVIDAERAVLAMVRLAVESGAVVHTGAVVSVLRREGSRWLVATEAGAEYRADHVVISAGGWLPDLVPQLPGALSGRLPGLTVRQENAYHFPYRDEKPWPTFIHKTGTMQVYSLPGGRDAAFRGQKLAEFNGGPSIGSAAAQTGQIDPVNRERVIAHVERNLPGLVPEPYAETTCLFTSTPHEDFVIDTADGVTVLSPCSGHGAKFAPLLGELAAASATGGVVPARFTLAHGVLR
ncbi:N-methyl-L-tryptophan oxidase [Kineosporia succinea]